MTKSIKIDEAIEDYISNNSYELHPVQKEIINYNKNLGDIKRMQISVTQGYFMQFLIRINNVKQILEVGTFTGYSALSMALVLPKNGKVFSIDKDPITNKIANKFFKEAKVLKKIKTKINNAMTEVKSLLKNKKKFDLILIDADKESYIDYFNYSIKLLKKNGVILIDNTLWKGEVSNPKSIDKLTIKLKKFNDHVKKANINKYILPLGDGFTICWK